MKNIGYLLLAIGFLYGSYVVVAHVEYVDKASYTLALVAMVVGMVCIRLGSRAGADDHLRHAEDVEVLQGALQSLIGKVRSFGGIERDEDLLGLHHRIDAELMDDLDKFVTARESMIPQFGMQRYADIMSPFATGERLLNRAWSASADGYVDEVRICLNESLAELESAQVLLLEATKEPAG